MNNEIFIQSASPDNNYICIIESDDKTVWMYLHDANDKCLIADSPVCSKIELMELKKFKEQYKGKGAPPLVQEYSTDCAVAQDINEHRLDILWHVDSKSVIAALDDNPFSMIVVGEKKGYSKALKVNGPWGQPWNDEAYKKLNSI